MSADKARMVSSRSTKQLVLSMGLLVLMLLLLLVRSI